MSRLPSYVREQEPKAKVTLKRLFLVRVVL